MKSILNLIVLLFVALNLHATDKPKPEADEEKVFSMPEYTDKKLSNGMRVLVFEDKEQPVIDFEMYIEAGSKYYPENYALPTFVAELLTKGTKSRKGYEIALALENKGLNLSSYANSNVAIISGGGLKKHKDLLFSTFADIVLNPSFPKDELEKLKNQYISNIISQKSVSGSLAGKLLRTVIYGQDSPYSYSMKEKDVEKVKISDIEEFWKKHYVANNATIAIVGDIKANEAIALLEKHLGKWKQAEKIIEKPKLNTESLPLGVYFIDRPGAVQSTVYLAAPTIEFSNMDYDAVSMATDILTGSFTSRLNQSLREKYSFLYSPTGYLTRNADKNYYFCGGDVRTNATDSTIIVIKQELEQLAKDKVEEDELNRVKNYVDGRFKLALEEPSYISSLALDAISKDINISYYLNAANRKKSISSVSLLKAASKYLASNRFYVVVVGNTSVKESLSQFGTVFEFNNDIEAITGPSAKLEKTSLSVEDVFNKYKKAVEGTNKFNDLKSLVIEGDVVMFSGQTPMNGKSIMLKENGKYHSIMDFGNFIQQKWYDGTKGWEDVMGNTTQVYEKELDLLKIEASLFPEISTLPINYKAEVKGKLKNTIVIDVAIHDQVSTMYFDENTGYLVRKENQIDWENGKALIVQEISDYMDFSGYMLPKSIKTTSSIINLNMSLMYQINPTIEQSEFTPQSNSNE